MTKRGHLTYAKGVLALFYTAFGTPFSGHVIAWPFVFPVNNTAFPEVSFINVVTYSSSTFPIVCSK